MVFRLSGGLAGPDELRELEVAGLRRVVDLRGEDEDRSVIAGWAAAGGVDYVAQPIPAANGAQLREAFGQANSDEEAAEHLSAIYRRVVDEHGHAVAGTIAALVDHLPAGYGCAAGKDRTGIVTAFLHVLLGVPEDEAARRYVGGAPPIERLRTLARDYFEVDEGAELPAGVDVLLGAREATILETLEHVRSEHGGVPAYLAAHGLQPEAVEALRERLVERGG